MGKANEITVREQRFIAGLVDGKSQTQAARDAGIPDPRRMGSVLANRENIRQTVRAYMEEAGIGPQALIGKLRDGLDAELKGLTKDGDVVTMGPDWHARAKLLDMAYKLQDFYPNPRLDVDLNMRGAIVVMRPEDGIAPDPFASPDVIDVTPEDSSE